LDFNTEEVEDAIRELLHNRLKDLKTHGIGDAGHYARYSFLDGKPKLEEYRARFDWRGREYALEDVIKSPPKTWKRYFP
jgi:hypothetical protein